jgi:dCTP diphosphatase
MFAKSGGTATGTGKADRAIGSIGDHRPGSRACRIGSSGAWSSLAMTDGETTVGQLKSLVQEFSRERDWEQFHHPKDLGLALASEVGELLDHFRFKSDSQVLALLDDESVHREVAHELADCLWALLRLASVCRVDLSSSLLEKVDLAARKYPVDRSFGRNDKYTAYREPDAPAEG